METVIDLLEWVEREGSVDDEDGVGDDGDTIVVEDSILIAGERTYDSARFVDSVFKTGNYLRHCGVHEGSVVEVVQVTEPETIFGILGTALLEGRVTFEMGRADSPAARLGPTEQLDAFDIPPGCTAIGFGTPPANPSWAYFEREVWSENPFFPPVEFDPQQPFLDTGATDGSFQTLLQQARTGSESFESEDVVAIRDSIGEPGVFVAGVLGPLVAGATILLPDDGQTGTVAVGTSSVPESRVVDPTSFTAD